jgi:hypothetical protein
MDLCNPFVLGFSRFDPCHARRRATLLQLLHDRTQTIRGLRMAGAHVVFKIGRMVHKTGSHNLIIHARRSARFDHRRADRRLISGLGSLWFSDASTKLADFQRLGM